MFSAVDPVCPEDGVNLNEADWDGSNGRGGGTVECRWANFNYLLWLELRAFCEGRGGVFGFGEGRIALDGWT